MGDAISSEFTLIQHEQEMNHHSAINTEKTEDTDFLTDILVQLQQLLITLMI